MKPPRCQKAKYPTHAAATRALRGHPDWLGGPVRVYRCGKHNKPTWHLTHKLQK